MHCRAACIVSGCPTIVAGAEMIVSPQESIVADRLAIPCGPELTGSARPTIVAPAETIVAVADTMFQAPGATTFTPQADAAEARPSS